MLTLDALPNEILGNVMARLSVCDVSAATQASRSLRRACDDHVWRRLAERAFGQPMPPALSRDILMADSPVAQHLSLMSRCAAADCLRAHSVHSHPVLPTGSLRCSIVPHSGWWCARKAHGSSQSAT